jgi:hypothetical protein
VHFTAAALAGARNTPPNERAVLNEVLSWKHAMKPPLAADEVILAMRSLAMLGWLKLKPAPDLRVDEAALVGLDDRELALF